MAKKEKDQIQKIINIKNRKASHEYQFVDKYVAGIVLKGTEIKSIRMAKVNMQGAYCLFINGECWLRDLHISPYSMAGFINHEAKTDRKLLLSKKELLKIEQKQKETGLTIVPTRVFVNNRGLAKVEIALAKGKKLYDKRQDLKAKDSKRDLERY